MTRSRRAVLVAVAAWVGLGSLAAAAAPMRMTVHGATGLAPADVVVRLYVVPGGRGREVYLELDGDRRYRSSVLPIRPERDTPSTQDPVWYGGLPAGAYLITATLSECAPAGCGARVELARLAHPVEIR